MTVKNPHSKAVEAAIRASKNRLPDHDAPLIELARTLAKQMDCAGPDGPSTRLSAAYLTTIRTLSARLALIGAPAPVSRLGQLRAARQGQSA